MTAILRLTRHSILDPKAAPGAYPADEVVVKESAALQLAALRRIFGEDVEIIENLTFNLTGDPVEAVKAAITATGAQIEAVEVVLPPNLLMPLTNPNAGLPKIIRAAMAFGDRRADGEPLAPARFDKYQQIVKVEVLAKDL